MMVSYTATSMALAIATGQNVVAVANLFMTITFVFMIVSSIIYFTREKSKLHRVQPNSAKRPRGWVWICAFQNNLGLGARRGEFPCGIVSSSGRQSTASNVEKCSERWSMDTTRTPRSLRPWLYLPLRLWHQPPGRLELQQPNQQPNLPEAGCLKQSVCSRGEGPHGATASSSAAEMLPSPPHCKSSFL